MSYARFSEDSNVYVYMYTNALVCSGCALEDETFYAFSTAEMIDHLEAHRAAGHLVPADVVPALLKDDAENFPAEVTG